MLRYFILLLLALPAIVVGVALTRPNALHVERSKSIPVAPEVAFAHINDLTNWPGWSPWQKLDPQMKSTFTDPAAGKGATYRWAGNEQVGEGHMRIERSTSPSEVVMSLVFEKPFEAQSTVTFSLAPDGDGTRVTWAMDSANGFVAKLASLFVDMESQAGQNFERGLDNLARVLSPSGP